MPLKPSIDTPPVKPAETLQPCHIDTHLKLLQTDRTFGRVDTVFLRRLVGKHAGPALLRSGRLAVAWSRDAPSLRRRTAVRHDTRRDVLFTPGLEVGQGAGGQLAVADGTLVLLRDLAAGLRLGNCGQGAVGATAATAGDGRAGGWDWEGLGR